MKSRGAYVQFAVWLSLSSSPWRGGDWHNFFFLAAWWSALLIDNGNHDWQVRTVFRSVSAKLLVWGLAMSASVLQVLLIDHSDGRSQLCATDSLHAMAVELDEP